MTCPLANPSLLKDAAPAVSLTVTGPFDRRWLVALSRPVAAVRATTSVHWLRRYRARRARVGTMQTPRPKAQARAPEEADGIRPRGPPSSAPRRGVCRSRADRGRDPIVTAATVG